MFVLLSEKDLTDFPEDRTFWDGSNLSTEIPNIGRPNAEEAGRLPGYQFLNKDMTELPAGYSGPSNSYH